MSEQSPFSKKTVYHSQLVAEGQMEILINSDVTKSKFKKEGEDQFFIDFKYKGKPQQYIIENASIQKKLNGLKGHVVQITATGSREDADMEIYDAAGPASDKTQAHREEPTHPHAPPQRPPPTGDVHPVTAAKRALLQHINARLLALEAAKLMSVEWESRHPEFTITDDHFERIGSNFYIALDRKGLIDILPYEMIQPKTATAPKQPPPKPKPEPPPKPAPTAPAPDDDEIPF